MTVAVGDRVHPATRDLDLEWDRTDVWYQWQSRPTGQVHTVARYHATNAPAGDGTTVGGTDQPISWCRDYRGGRSFYTGMGRTAGAFGEEGLRTHLAGALRWTTGLERAGCKATIASNYEGKKIVAAASPAGRARQQRRVARPRRPPRTAGCSTSAAATAAPTRSAAGCSAWPRSAASSTTRTRTSASAAAPSTSGIPRRPTAPSTAASPSAGKLAVYGDGGQGGERTDEGDHKMEYGLLGITVAPDFATTGHIYLQYFPSFNPESTPPGLPESRRISKMSEPRISRFTIDLDDEGARPRVRGRDLQVRRPDLLLLPRRRWHGLRLGGQPLRHDGRHELVAGQQRLLGQQPGGQVPDGAERRGLERPLRHRGLLVSGRTPDRGQHERLQRQDAPVPAQSGSAGRFRRGTRPEQHVHAAGRGLAERARTCSAGRSSVPATPPASSAHGPRSTPWACATRRACTSIRRRTSRTRRGWVPTPGTRARPRARRRTRTRPRSRTRATTAGPTAWATARPTATASPTATCAPPTRRATSRAGRPAAAPTAGTTATTSTTTHPTTPAWSSCRTRPARGWTRASSATSTSGTAAATRTTPTAARTSRVRAARTRRPTTAPRRPSCCPYLINEGMTVMAGPVYRYDDEAADDSRRWPEYWDGRWFLHNNGGASAKHALLFDPATVGDGGQPVYADSFRGVLNWDAGVHGLEVRRGRRALRPGLRRASSARARTPASGASTTPAAPNTPGANPQRVPARRQPRRLLERRLGRHRLRVGLR